MSTARLWTNANQDHMQKGANANGQSNDAFFADKSTA